MSVCCNQNNEELRNALKTNPKLFILGTGSTWVLQSILCKDRDEAPLNLIDTKKETSQFSRNDGRDFPLKLTELASFILKRQKFAESLQIISEHEPENTLTGCKTLTVQF